MLSNGPSLLKPEDANASNGRSCDQCRQRKIRCNFGKPQCSTCDRRNKVCTYNDPVKKRGPKPKATNAELDPRENDISPEFMNSKSIPIPIKVSLAENQGNQDDIMFNINGENFSPSNVSMFDYGMGFSNSSNSSLNLRFQDMNLSTPSSFVHSLSHDNSPTFMPSDSLFYNPDPFDLNQIISPENNVMYNWVESNQDTIRTHFHQSEYVSQVQPLSQEIYQPINASAQDLSSSYKSGIHDLFYFNNNNNEVTNQGLFNGTISSNDGGVSQDLFNMSLSNDMSINQGLSKNLTSNANIDSNQSLAIKSDSEYSNMNGQSEALFQMDLNEGLESIPISHLTEKETYLISLYYSNVHPALPIIPFETLLSQLENIENDNSLKFMVYCMCAVAASTSKDGFIHDHFTTFYTLSLEFAPTVSDRSLSNFKIGADLLRFYFQVEV
ncbi:hypothetical protein K502DRAFT_322513 [Neoconidiobolus thromboides FSU 785]|nr:hypothetical protein K502DRAFT_322513 [Neoconidiobolus thromboides FSU 785]